MSTEEKKRSATVSPSEQRYSVLLRCDECNTEYPIDSPKRMKELMESHNITYPKHKPPTMLVSILPQITGVTKETLDTLRKASEGRK